jgi:hypothetical protein
MKSLKGGGWGEEEEERQRNNSRERGDSEGQLRPDVTE